MMTDEQLTQKLQEVAEGIAKLSNPEKPLSREEQELRLRFLRRQDILSRIKAAKTGKHRDAELYHTTLYDLLVPWGEKHPVLMFIMMMMMRVRWSTGTFQRF